MTENDNFRHYIGDVEATEDIDVVFKHIYDLMLANGGEGTGLNADMVDGYHASDFAPASLRDDIDKCIHSIQLSDDGAVYTDPNVILNILTNHVTYYRTEDHNNPNAIREPIKLDEFLDEIDTALDNVTTEVFDVIQPSISFLGEDGDESVGNSLKYIIEHNLKTDTNNNNYLDSDSVNGLSFRVLTQDQYDALSRTLKEDPRNIFIINNDLDTDLSQESYTPPSILQAGLALEFRINTETHNIEYSVDGKASDDNTKVWKVATPLVFKDNKKGFLYPKWFKEVGNVIENDESLQRQSDYPFILNTASNQQLLSDISNKVNTITIGNETLTPDNSHDINLDTNLDNVITSRLNAQSFIDSIDSRIQNQAEALINSNSSLEKIINKKTNISNNLSNTYYPTTQAVSDYVTLRENALKAEINSLKNKLSDTGWIKITNFNTGVKAYPEGYVPQIRRIGKIVMMRGALTVTKAHAGGSLNGVEEWCCIIPDQFRPSMWLNFVQQGTNNARFTLTIDNGYPGNGADVIIRRYENNGSTTIPKNAWLNLCCTYFVD